MPPFKDTCSPLPRPFSNQAIAVALAALQLLPATTAYAQQTVPTQFEYDAQGNLTKVIDANGKVTVLEHDTLNRIKKQTLPAPSANTSQPEVRYTYDTQDRLISVKDPRGRLTYYARLGLSDIAQVSPDTGVSYDWRDEAGNPSYRSNDRNQSAFVQYDALNRPTQIGYYNENATSGASFVNGKTLLTYDLLNTTAGAENYGIGRLGSVIEQRGASLTTVLSTLFHYDQLGRITKRQQSVPNLGVSGQDTLVQRWGPDNGTNATRLVGLTYPSGRLVDYEYDALGHVKGITTTSPGGSTQWVVSNASYTPLSVAEGVYGLTGFDFGIAGNQFHERSYDTNGRVNYFTLGEGLPNYGIQYAYQLIRDEVGQIKTIRYFTPTNTARSINYSYDDLGRLINAALPGAIIYSYEYDLNGNRTLKVASSISTQFTYSNISNKLTAVSVGGGANQSVSTDSTGNITEDPATPVGTVTYTYSDRTNVSSGRMIRSQGPGGQYDYLHSHFEQRIRKTGSSYTTAGGTAISPVAYLGSTDTLFHYDLQGHLIAEMDAETKKVKREYIWLEDMAVAVIAGAIPTEPISATNEATVYYIHNDHLNTPRLVTDQNAIKRWEWPLQTSEPFGASAPNEAPNGQATAQQFTLNLRFPGQYLDKETGTFYNYHRTYNPSTGRYLQSDPIGLQGGLNTYGYVEGNPLGLVDPLGLWSLRNQGPVNLPSRPGPGSSSSCVTAECAAGLPPTPPDNRSQSEIDQSQCELICGVLGPGNVIPGGFAISKLLSWAVVNGATSAGCKVYCKEKDKCDPK